MKMRLISIPLPVLLLGLNTCGQAESVSSDSGSDSVGTGAQPTELEAADGSGGTPQGNEDSDNGPKVSGYGTGGNTSAPEFDTGGSNNDNTGGRNENDNGGESTGGSESDDGTGGSDSNGTGGNNDDGAGGSDDSGDGSGGNAAGGSAAVEVTCTGEAFDGDLVLKKQADIDALAGVEEVTGSLAIGRGGDGSITSLAPLACLKTVGVGSTASATGLWIERNSSLLSLDGLEALTSIGGELVLQDNSALLNLSGFTSLEKVDFNVVVIDNLALTSVEGLSSLKSVKGFFWMYGNEALPACDAESLIDTIGVSNITGELSVNNNAGTCPP